jgi:exosortase/archaeosortase family protein
MIRADRLRLFFRRERAGIRFCALFALFTVLGFAVIYAAGDVVVRALNRHIAWTAALALRVLGTSAASAGAVVSAGGFAVEIKNNCNAIYEFGLYAAAVGAYPTSIGAKAAGILVGGGVLYTVNLARVVSLMALGMFARDWFEVSHLYVWQALFFATVVTCWFGWILRIRPRA